MQKVKVVIGIGICLGLLAACGGNKETTKTTTTTASAVTKDSSTATKSSSTQTSVSQQVSPFSGYSDEQIEYARVTEALVHHYGMSQQPIEITVHKNPRHTAVFPYSGSVSMDFESVTLSFSTDGTMAGTVIVTYRSHQDGSITFYKNPNHYQDSRYLNDSDWVKTQSQALLNSAQSLSLPTEYDQDAAKIIPLIKVN